MLKRSKLSVLFFVIVFLFQSISMTVLSTSEGGEAAIDAPATQISLMALDITDSAVELVWTSEQNSVKAESYDIYRNDSLIKTINSFTYTDAELAPETSYAYIVKVKDGDGNVIAQSNRINVATISKVTLPPAPPVKSEVRDYVANDSQPSNFVMVKTSAADAGKEAAKVTGNALTAKGNLDFLTDRFIIKYKNGQDMQKLNKMLDDKAFKSKEIKGGKNGKLEVISLEERIKLKDFISGLGDIEPDIEIEYIQPDYEINLSSNDPYFNSQWGLENNREGNAEDNTGSISSNTSVLERIRKILPHMADAIEADEECLGFFTSAPKEELLKRIEAMNVPGNLPPDLLMEFRYDPMLRDTMLRPRMPSNGSPAVQPYFCDAGVTETWENTTGSGIIIGIIDTGIDITHEDLAENIWINSGEIAGNGIDDDNNGYIDDINGWNFSKSNNEVYDGSNMSDDSHGTHIAGIIAAVKDNEKGIAGVAPSAKVMPLKVFKNGTAYTSDIIEAIAYAEMAGVKIVNCSWGCTGHNRALYEAIQNSEMLFVCAAGNYGVNIDESPVYPAAFDCPNIISVASVNENGILSSFSNYGENTVDVAAPGEKIISTWPDNQYKQESGTSMAAAFVSAEGALLLDELDSMNVLELKERIINSSDRISTLTGKVFRSSKINCTNAMDKVNVNEIIQINRDVNVQENSHIDNGSSEFTLFSAPSVTGQFLKVATAYSHTIALRNDGTVWTCGDNDYGQLGDGTTTDRLKPVQVSGLDGVTAVDAGTYHTIALKNDGTVWSWGRNLYGQLGDGTTTDRLTPVQVSGLSGITTVAGGMYYTLALKNDGTVWAWGCNIYGSLGDGTTIDRLTPVQVSGLSSITMIAAGNFHNMSLKNDGTVWTWGRNSYGQLGDGTTTDRPTAMQVSGLTGITMIAAGMYYTLALKNDGTLWTWGNNYYSQLGDGTTTNRTVPVQVIGVNGINTISAGYYHTITLMNDGTIWAWGYNRYGQLGDGTTTNRATLVQVNGPNGITTIAGGYYHNLALTDDGTIWGWGLNEYGQLGDDVPIYRTVPLQINGLNEVAAVDVGADYTVALRNDGTVWTCGYNEYGQLGDGTSTERMTPVQVNGINGITYLDADGYHTIAVKNDGTIWTWGLNNLGQLGDGTCGVYRPEPVQIVGLSGVAAAVGGGYHTIVLKNDGTVWTCGENAYGQLGDGTTTYRTTLVQVNGLSGIIAVAGGYRHSIALKNDGTVWAWGYNAYGQLGDGMTTNRTTPVQVSGLGGVAAIASGYLHTLALKNDGTVWAWGDNEYGQLGDGTTTNRTTPVQVSGLSEITALGDGKYHNFAFKSDGTVWGWGYNGLGGLGDGTTINRIMPVYIGGHSVFSSIAGGREHTAALKNDGTVWTWGDNFFGQLGNGEASFCLSPKWLYGTPAFSPITINTSVECTIDDPINLVLNVQNVYELNGLTFTVTYDTDDIDEVVDLCVMTHQKELNIGLIQGTGITIIQNDPGVIKFTVDKTISLGKTWSGAVNVVKLKPAISGQTTLTYTVE